MRKTLLCVCMAAAALLAAASVLAAQAPRHEFRPMAIEGTPFHEGDSLVLLASGQVRWLREGRVVATLNDPEGLIRASGELEADRALYVTDDEGGRVADFERGGTLFLSSDAPKVIFHQRGVVRKAGAAGDMTWHNGTVLVANKTMAIFWGSWGSPGDIITGFDSFFSGFGGSGYAGDSTEYTGSNGQVSSSSTYLGHVLDTSAPPKRSPSVATMVAEACKITNNNPDPNALYLMYTSNFPRQNSFCAWHSYGNCSNGAPVQVANMPNTTGIAGCDPADTWTTNSQGLASLANVTGHELSETITDPRNGGWYDANGQENGDKCAWVFNHVVTLKNGALFKIQMEWSNNAFNAGTGFLNSSGQPGCLQ